MANLKALGLAEALREAAPQHAATRHLPGAGAFSIFWRRMAVRSAGLLPGTVRKFAPADRRDKIPKSAGMPSAGKAPRFAGIESGSEFYFVHSYYIVPADGKHLGATDYAGVSFHRHGGAGQPGCRPVSSGKIRAHRPAIAEKFYPLDTPC